MAGEPERAWLGYSHLSALVPTHAPLYCIVLAVRGLSVQSLIKNCWLGQWIAKTDRKFIEHLKETRCSCVKRGQLRKLLASARQLGEIEQYASIGG